MQIRVGYRIEIVTAQPTPKVVLLDPHPSRRKDMVRQPKPQINSIVDGKNVRVEEYNDSFGNQCRRLVIPQGGAVFTNDVIVSDPGLPDEFDKDAPEVWPADLPAEVTEYTLASRYCEVDELSATAWNLFGNFAPGWNRVQQICNYVNA